VAGGAFATSPLIDDDLVFIETGGTQGNSFVALDLKTGRTKWSAESDSAAFASPTSITLNGEKQVVFFSADGVVSLSPRNGALNWRFPWKTPWGITTNTPIFIHPDKLFISSINDMGSALIQFASENEDSLISEVWRSNRVMNSYSTVVVHDGYVYGFQNKFLSCVALETGEEKWRQRGFSYGSLVFVDGQLVVVNRDRTLPLYYLRRWLVNGFSSSELPTEGHVVVVQSGTQRVGFLVDELIGQEEVVIKPLGALLHGTAGLAGATITGDGGIAIILDIPGLMRRYGSLR